HTRFSRDWSSDVCSPILFIERAMSLVTPDGRLGFIIPHKFMTIQAGRALRRLLTAGHALEEIVHFGVQQVFSRLATNYTCLLILDRKSTRLNSSHVKISY